MTDFRIMPAQHLERISGACTRYGFIIESHPKGIVEGKAPHESYRDTGYPFNRGDYIASWATETEARVAASCLGLDPNTAVRAVQILVPQEPLL